MIDVRLEVEEVHTNLKNSEKPDDALRIFCLPRPHNLAKIRLGGHLYENEGGLYICIDLTTAQCRMMADILSRCADYIEKKNKKNT